MSDHPDGPYLSRPGPNLAAGALALGMHVLFALLLIFGVSWQTRHPEPVMVDVWEALPPPAPAPRPKPVEIPPPPAPPKPVPPAEHKPAPAKPEAPDIALEKKKAEAKAKAEAERVAKLKAVQEAEAKSQAEAMRLEAEAIKREREKQAAAERKKKELLRQAEEEDMLKRLANEEAAAEARVAAARRQTEVDRLVGLHRDKISAKVRSNTRLPGTLKGNPEVRCLVRLLPTGEVQSVRITQSSGDVAYDEAVVLAIQKSSPLPLPADRDARAAFVPELSFVHRPKE